MSVKRQNKYALIQDKFYKYSCYRRCEWILKKSLGGIKMAEEKAATFLKGFANYQYNSGIFVRLLSKK